MDYKKLLSYLALFCLLIGSAFAADFYESYRMSFLNETPSSMAVLPYVCTNAGCTTASGINIEVYKGDAIQCWTDFGQSGQTANYLSCMQNYKVTGNVVNLTDCSVLSNGCAGDPYIFVKYDTTATFGYVSYFFTTGDTYVPYKVRSTSFSCTNDICVNVNPTNVLFGRIANATAEVGQLNILNIDNSSKPVQVTVPVTIDQSVCSAFRFSDSSVFKPTAPVGFSDYSANTAITLRILNGTNPAISYLNQTINIAIEADTCAGLAAFSWTPSQNLVNTSVKFAVTTDVIDAQIVNSIVDSAEVTEVVYPTNLNGTCWTRSYDMTLSNTANFALNTSVAQITQGESLYVGFLGGAYRDNAITPMNYVANLYFNNTLVSTGNFVGSSNLQNSFVNLSSNIAGLAPGAYNVTLITTPVGAGCTLSSSVTQTQNLQILAPVTNTLTFHVRDSNFTALNNSQINLRLMSADDYYQVTPVFNTTLSTDAQGTLAFSSLISGNYDYTISKPGYTTVSGSVHVASNSDIYITLPRTNLAPIVNLPTEVTQYYLNTQTIDLRNYIVDYNNLFSELTITSSIVSGTGFISYAGGIITASTTTPNDLVLRVTAADPSGLNSTDTMTIHFVNNSAPVIVNFVATPDNGQVNLTTSFTVSVTDADNNTLTCILDFGDGQNTTGACSSLNGVSHTYTNVGTFNAILRVNDGVTTEVTGLEQVFVFARVYASPQINSLNVVSQNGIYTPTNLTLTWNVTHPNNLAMTCTLRYNLASYAVPCTSTGYNISNFNVTGLTRFTLTAFDGTNQDTRFVDLTLFNPLVAGPVINYFTLATATGTFVVPNNLTLGYGVVHPQGLAMNCSMIVNGVVSPVACSPAGTFTVTNFNVTGASTFVFRATDGTAINNMTINQVFVSSNVTNNTVDLTLDLVDLVLENTIVPGEFEFGVSVINETLNSRDLRFKPSVSCDGVVISLANSNKMLDSSAVSKVQRKEGFVYSFKLNTQDFNAMIPLDKNCRFMLNVLDDYGTDIVVTQAVTFSYPEEERKIQSIRGKGTDIVDFMSVALSNEIKPGYNAIEFRVVNNEFVDKDLSITLISQNLNINYNEKLSLGAGQERSVTIPLYVEKGTEKGSYPVRFAVSEEGSDKQVRYSYIIVN